MSAAGEGWSEGKSNAVTVMIIKAIFYLLKCFDIDWAAVQFETC